MSQREEWREVEVGEQREGRGVTRGRWIEDEKEATDAGDAGVAQVVGDQKHWQMHYQRHLHPR